jgi:hypothetical protein
MKSKIKNGIKILTVFSCIIGSGCKVNDRITPVANANLSMASISVLKTYLSKTLAVSADEISYNSTSHEFTVRNSILMKESDIQNHYRIANEYKVRNKIID